MPLVPLSPPPVAASEAFRSPQPFFPPRAARSLPGRERQARRVEFVVRVVLAGRGVPLLHQRRRALAPDVPPLAPAVLRLYCFENFLICVSCHYFFSRIRRGNNAGRKQGKNARRRSRRGTNIDTSCDTNATTKFPGAEKILKCALFSHEVYPGDKTSQIRVLLRAHPHMACHPATCWSPSLAPSRSATS